jgi:hypothetical protein
MEAMQVIEKHAEHTPDPAMKLLDCSQAPEVAALGNLSDAQLIDLLRSDPGNALYLVAFYHVHAGLVRTLLAAESKSENLNRWIWFSAFRTLIHSQKTVIPVAGWLGRIVALSLINRELPPVQGKLPIPLAWYLHQSLEMMPIPLRITAVMGEIAKSTNKEISEFFHLRQMPLSETEVEQLRNEAHRFLVDRIPVDVRRLYFGDPLDVESPIQLLSSLGVDVQSEIQHFERWHGVQVDSLVPPIATASRTNDLKQNGKSTKNPLAPVLLVLLLIAGGVAALFALVSGSQQSTVSPTSLASSTPAVTSTTTANSSKTVPASAPESATTISSAILGSTPTNQTVASSVKPRSTLTEKAAIPSIKLSSESTSITVVSSPKPSAILIDKKVASSPKLLPDRLVLPAKPITTSVLPKTNSAPSEVTVPTVKPTATTAVPKPKLLPKVAVIPKAKPPAPSASVITSNGQLPLLDDAPRNRPPRFFAVMVADPLKKNLASVRRFEPGSYYRSLQGKPWIQVGAYDTLAKANMALQEFKARGFTVTLGRT